MTRPRFLFPLVLAGALVVGCEKKNEPKVDNTPKTPTMNDVKAGADKASDRTKEAASDATKNTTDAAKTAADTAKSTATDAAETVKTQATDWYAKAEDAVKNNKLDDAKTYLDKLESFKSKLSTEWQTKIDALQSAYTAARAKVTAKPATPNLNK
jgi:hypothetical protein